MGEVKKTSPSKIQTKEQSEEVCTSLSKGMLLLLRTSSKKITLRVRQIDYDKKNMFLSWPRTQNKEPRRTVTCRLRDLRFQRKITQRELANALKVSRRNIVAIENQQYYPSLLLAFKISHYFRVPLEKIFSFTEKSTAESADTALEFEQMVIEELKKTQPEIDWEEAARLKRSYFPNSI